MTVSEINALVSETRIAATPETVFAFFVDPNKMVRWMGSRAEADPRPGGLYALDINALALWMLSQLRASNFNSIQKQMLSGEIIGQLEKRRASGVPAAHLARIREVIKQNL